MRVDARICEWPRGPRGPAASAQTVPLCMCFGVATVFIHHQQRRFGRGQHPMPASWTDVRRWCIFSSFFILLFRVSRCRSDFIANRSFKTALNAHAVPVDYGRSSLLPIPKGCINSREHLCSKLSAWYQVYRTINFWELNCRWTVPEHRPLIYEYKHEKTFSLDPLLGSVGQQIHHGRIVELASPSYQVRWCV